MNFHVIKRKPKINYIWSLLFKLTAFLKNVYSGYQTIFIKMLETKIKLQIFKFKIIIFMYKIRIPTRTQK